MRGFSLNNLNMPPSNRGPLSSRHDSQGGSTSPRRLSLAGRKSWSWARPPGARRTARCPKHSHWAIGRSWCGKQRSLPKHSRTDSDLHVAGSVNKGLVDLVNSNTLHFSNAKLSSFGAQTPKLGLIGGTSPPLIVKCFNSHFWFFWRFCVNHGWWTRAPAPGEVAGPSSGNIVQSRSSSDSTPGTLAKR